MKNILWSSAPMFVQQVERHVATIQRTNPNYLVYHLCRSLTLAGMSGLSINFEEARFLVTTLIDLRIPPVEVVPNSEMPRLIVHLLLGALGVQPQSMIYQPLSDADIEFSKEQIEQIPLLSFVERLKAQLDPVGAYMLLVAIECFWLLNLSVSEAESVLADLFNIREGTKK